MIPSKGAFILRQRRYSGDKRKKIILWEKIRVATSIYYITLGNSRIFGPNTNFQIALDKYNNYKGG